jgi:hypothetical protein
LTYFFLLFSHPAAGQGKRHKRQHCHKRHDSCVTAATADVIAAFAVIVAIIIALIVIAAAVTIIVTTATATTTIITAAAAAATATPTAIWYARPRLMLTKK